MSQSPTIISERKYFPTFSYEKSLCLNLLLAPLQCFKKIFFWDFLLGEDSRAVNEDL